MFTGAFATRSGGHPNITGERLSIIPLISAAPPSISNVSAVRTALILLLSASYRQHEDTLLQVQSAADELVYTLTYGFGGVVKPTWSGLWDNRTLFKPGIGWPVVIEFKVRNVQMLTLSAGRVEESGVVTFCN